MAEPSPEQKPLAVFGSYRGKKWRKPDETEESSPTKRPTSANPRPDLLHIRAYQRLRPQPAALLNQTYEVKPPPGDDSKLLYPAVRPRVTRAQLNNAAYKARDRVGLFGYEYPLSANVKSYGVVSLASSKCTVLEMLTQTNLSRKSSCVRENEAVVKQVPVPSVLSLSAYGDKTYNFTRRSPKQRAKQCFEPKRMVVQRSGEATPDFQSTSVKADRGKRTRK